MRAENSFKCAQNYLSGFHNVYNHASLGETLLGMIKILSYLFILPEIIAGVIYFTNKKVVAFQDEIDGKIDAKKISDVFARTAQPFNKDSGEARLITYLVDKLANFEEGDDATKHKERFSIGFKQLTSEGQLEFFKQVANNDCMQLTLEWIPKDIEELNFVSGAYDPITQSYQSAKNVELLFVRLPNFTNLRKIGLNLRGLGFYTKTINSQLEAMSKLTGEIHVYSAEPFNNVMFQGMNYNHCFPQAEWVMKTFEQLRTLIQTRPHIKWSFNFANLALVGNGTNVTSVGNVEPIPGMNQTLGFVDPIKAYFAKPLPVGT